MYDTMSDSFQVAAESAELLSSSRLVGEMKHCARQMDMFPVLIGEHVGYFHRVDGGYSRAGSESENTGYHVVNLIHEVQGTGSPPNKTHDSQIEAHIDDTYFYLEVDDVWEFGDYPDEEYTLSVKVTNYRDGKYAFTEELQPSTEVDKRETEYSWEG